jgi:hypothetical protein
MENQEKQETLGTRNRTKTIKRERERENIKDVQHGLTKNGVSLRAREWWAILVLFCFCSRTVKSSCIWNFLLILIDKVLVCLVSILSYSCCLNVAWRVPHIEAGKLLTPSGHLSCSTPGFSGVCVALSSVFSVVFCRILFVLFLIVILLSVHIWFTFDSVFGIFKFSY